MCGMSETTIVEHFCIDFAQELSTTVVSLRLTASPFKEKLRLVSLLYLLTYNHEIISIHPSIYPPIHPFIHPSIHPFFNLSIHSFIHSPILQSIHLPISLSLHRWVSGTECVILPRPPEPALQRQPLHWHQWHRELDLWLSHDTVTLSHDTMS